jgi:hypothetical protein
MRMTIGTTTNYHIPPMGIEFLKNSVLCRLYRTAKYRTPVTRVKAQ